MKILPAAAGLVLPLVLIASPGAVGVPQVDPKPLKIFVLAGQSNMEGQGVVDLDHPEHYNGGRGTLEAVLRDPSVAARYAHVKDADGRWSIRDDVWVRFRTANGVKKGPLTIGFTGYPGAHHIGPEFQFGHVVGDAIDGPVLLIKTAWGGKSLHEDFRPPSSGGTTGPYYERMLAEIDEALANAADDFPAYDGSGWEFAGFVWFQGWNDMVDEPARAEYEENLVNLILDVRSALSVPDLPVVIGELGNGGPDASEPMLEIRRAQAAAAASPRVGDAVAFVETSSFARPAADSPNTGHGHHWFGNAESYFLIGDALARMMLELLELLDARAVPDRVTAPPSPSPS